nr:hypothetical protein [uncultured Butyricicoccus sp.]
MSIVLSYRALRDTSLSSDEAAAIDIVVARYQSDFEYRDTADAFAIHPHNPKAPNVIFSGTVCLPADDAESASYWMCCLTDIRRILEDADWHISLGDTPLEWDEDDGWFLPQN